MKKIAPVLFLALSAGSVFGQPCNVSKYGVPDFDQKRDYLDNNGAMYCVPTAALNWMGYIANRGRPAALAHSSPNWASMSEYALVDVRDHNMGGWMDTSGTGGTDTGDAVDGLVDYLNHYDVGPFMIMASIADEDWQVKPKAMYQYLKMGFLVCMMYGRYEKDGDQWERTGGHCVTVVALQDACNSSACRIGFHDPSSSDSINSQSAFTTKWWDITKQTRNYDGDVYSQWGPAGQASGPSDTIRLIDKYLIIMPMFVLAKDPLHINQLVMHSAPLLNNTDEAPTINITMPSSAALLHAFPDPRSPNTVVITAPIGAIPARVWDYDPVDRSFTGLLDLPANPGAFTIDRRGDLLLEINGDLHKYRRTADGSVVPVGMAKVGFPMQSIAVDDKTDDIYALGAGPRRLLKFPGGDLAAVPYNGVLPANMPMGIVPCIALNPADGKIWLCSEASTSIYQLTPGAAAPGWNITGAVQTGGGSQPTGLQFGDHGEMKFISGNQIREWEIDPASGRYVLSGDPHFQGLPATGFLSLSRSRSNFDPRLHTGPAWVNIENPDPNTPEFPECPADFNLDGYVDGIDYDEFNNLFERGHMNADVNFDGFVDGIDSDSFNNWFERGC